MHAMKRISFGSRHLKGGTIPAHPCHETSDRSMK
jgi:hypothetical protein